MKRAVLLLVLTMTVALPQGAAAQSEEADKARQAAFDKRVFAGPIGDKKAVACFVRRYDAGHLAKHRKQKVSAMKLVLTAEKAPGEPTAYAIRIGVQFRGKPGNFDGDSSCSHLIDEDGKKELSFGCGAECGGGGLEIAMSKDDRSAIVKLDAIGVYDRKHPDDVTVMLEGGADDKVFRLDRVDNSECVELLADHKRVASR